MSKKTAPASLPRFALLGTLAKESGAHWQVLSRLNQQGEMPHNALLFTGRGKPYQRLFLFTGPSIAVPPAKIASVAPVPTVQA